MNVSPCITRIVFFVVVGSALVALFEGSTAVAQTGTAAGHYQWVAVTNGEIPENAVPFGVSTTVVTGGGTRRSAMYVARGHFDNQRTSIAIADHNGCRGTSIHNRSRERIVQQFARYDVLVPAPGFRASWETIDRQELNRMTDEHAAQIGAVKVTVTFDGPEFTGFPVQFEWASSSGSSFRPAFYSGPTAFPAENRRMNLRPVDSYDDAGDEGPGFLLLVMRPIEAAPTNRGPAPPIPPDSF